METQVQSRAAIRCPLCRQPLLEQQRPLRCSTCETEVHARCARELGAGKCPTYGCSQRLGLQPRRTRAPQPSVKTSEPPGRVWPVSVVCLTWLLTWPLVVFVGPYSLALAGAVALWLSVRKHHQRVLAAAALLLSPTTLTVVDGYTGGLSDYASGEAHIEVVNGPGGPSAPKLIDLEVRCPVRIHYSGVMPLGAQATLALGNNAAVRQATRLFGFAQNAYPVPIPTPSQAEEQLRLKGRPATAAEVQEVQRHMLRWRKSERTATRWRVVELAPRARLFKSRRGSPFLFDDARGVVELRDRPMSLWWQH